MAVVSVSAIKDGRGGSIGFGQDRTYTRRFRVVTDSDTDGPLTVMLAVGVSVGEVYSTGAESDPLAYCKEISPEQSADDARVWTVTVSYSTRFAGAGSGSGSPGSGGASPAGRPTNPLDHPTEWKLTFVKAKKAVTTDKDGKDVKNSAGLFFNPPYERTIPMAQFTASKNYASVTFSDVLGYYDKINSGVWNGLAAKTVKVDGIDMQSAFENGVSYVKLTWVFLYDPDGWNPTRILDRGPFYLDAGGKPQYKTDGMGGLLPEVLLDGAGGLLVAPLAAVYNLFRFHDEISFASIP
jgi:hypothetical protein